MYITHLNVCTKHNRTHDKNLNVSMIEENLPYPQYFVENEKDIPVPSFSVHPLLLEAPSPSF